MAQSSASDFNLQRWHSARQKQLVDFSLSLLELLCLCRRQVLERKCIHATSLIRFGKYRHQLLDERGVILSAVSERVKWPLTACIVRITAIHRIVLISQHQLSQVIQSEVASKRLPDSQVEGSKGRCHAVG